MSEFICFFDGACAPTNPGGAMGMGALIYNDKEEIVYQDSRFREARKENTNNVAEYGALWYVLDWFIKNDNHAAKIIIYGDSQLVINQMSGAWRIKEGAYTKAAWTCKAMRDRFLNVKFKWIPREDNEMCDALSKAALDSDSD